MLLFLFSVPFVFGERGVCLDKCNINDMKTKQLYISPYVQIFSVMSEKMFALSFDRTNQTETMSWDSEEEDL